MATSGSVCPKTDPDGPPPSADPTENEDEGLWCQSSRF